MEATKTFIEKAIEGGWPPGVKASNDIFSFDVDSSGISYSVDPTRYIEISDILLDPEAWKAVGRVEWWSVEEGFKVSPVLHEHGDGEGYRELCSRVVCDTVGVSKIWPVWLKNMHRMIDAIAEGKTIEEYLSTLFSK